MRLTRDDLRILWRETLPDYGLSVAHHWWVIGFGVLLAIVGEVSNVFPNFHLPGWAWGLVALLGVFIAQFLAWNDMRKERDRLTRFQVTQAALVKVAEFRHTQIHMQNEPLPTDEVLGAWWQRYTTLRNEIISFLKINFSEAESLSFSMIGTFEMVFLPLDGDKPDYVRVQRRSWIIRDHKWLDELVKDYSRQRYRPEAGEASQ